MDNFYELSEDTISKFFEVFNKKTFPVSIKFQFEGDEKQKELIKISVVPPKFQFIIGKDLLISINEDILNVFDDESVTILLEQEIDKINMNIETGKIKLVKTDLNTLILPVTQIISWSLDWKHWMKSCYIVNFIYLPLINPLKHYL